MKILVTDYAWKDLKIESEILEKIGATHVPAETGSEEEQSSWRRRWMESSRNGTRTASTISRQEVRFTGPGKNARNRGLWENRKDGLPEAKGFGLKVIA